MCPFSPFPKRGAGWQTAVPEPSGGWQPGPGVLPSFLLLWGQQEDGEVNMSEPGGREDGRQQDTGTL